MSEKEERKVDMDVVVAKVLSLVIVTTVTVLVGLIPCRLVRHFSRTMFRAKQMFDNMVSGAKCFSGGVFLGTCFLHLIPGTRNSVDNVLDQLGSRSQYPVAELLTMAGFFAVVFCEHVIRCLYYKLQENTCFPSLYQDSYSFDQDYLPTTEDPEFNGCELTECKSLHSSFSNHSGSQEDLHKHDVQKHEQTTKLEDNLNRLNESNPSNINVNHLYTQRDNRIEIDIEPAPLQELEVKTVVTEISKGEDGRGQVRSVLLLTALSFHGVFEGMTLGLQSQKSDVWVMCVAIVIHRGILSFGLSLQYARNYEKASAIVFTINAFSIICAVGVIIGMAISTGAQLYTDVNVPNAILQSIATGTIFYIVFLNILFKELDGNRDAKKISCTFVGFAFMAIVLAVAKQ